MPRLLFACLLTAVLLPRLSAQTLDLTYNPGASADIFGLVAQPDGKILVGGNFKTIGGVARDYLARLNPDGTVDASFNPGASITVRTFAVQPDGRILVCGSFTTIAGVTRVRLARLNANGSPDASFNAGADADVQSLALQPDGKVLFGGLFASVNNTPRTLLARVNPDGSLDSAFSPSISGTAAGNQQRVDAIAVQSDGRILIGGNFGQVAGTARSGLARLNADGSLDTSFAIGSGASSSVQAIVLQPDGKILVGGSFSTFSGQPRRGLARLGATGTLDNVGVIGPGASVNAIVLQPDGSFLAGGTFNTVGSVARNRLARFSADGTFDATYNPDVTGAVGLSTPGIYTMVSPAPGLIVIGGTFANVSGQPRSGIARLGSPFPVFTRQPTDLVAGAGASVILSVAAANDPIRYEWRRNGLAIPGATRSTLAIGSLGNDDIGTYTVAVSNLYGTNVSTPATVSLGSAAPPTFTFSTLAGLAGEVGRVDGPGGAARFDHPTGLAVDSSGNLYTLDSTTNFIRKVTPGGVVTTFAAQGGLGLAADADGNLFVADGRSRVVRFTPNGTSTTFAGSATPGNADGPGATAQFDSPGGVAVDRTGTVYVADTNNRTIRRITPAGVVSTLAGAAGQSGSVDGSGAAARFALPRGLAFDLAGNLLVADGNALRRITPAGAVTTLARGTAIIGMAADAAGNVYLTDVGAHVVRRLNPAGLDTVVGGTAGLGGSSDGAGNTARLNGPWGIVTDVSGNLYIADNGNSTIRKAAAGAAPLALTLPPAATHTAAGVPVVLAVGATGAGLTYQWKKDGSVLSGATGATYALANPTAAHMGYYTVTVGSGGSALESAFALLTVSNPASPGRLINVATRGLVPAGEALTPGFVLRGTGAKQLVVRGVGPTLLRFGLGGSLGDPRFELAPLGGAVLLANDDWSAAGPLAAASAAVGAFPLDPLSRDAAALTSVNSNGSGAYTVRVTGATPTDSGIALAEIYDADPTTSPVQLANVSTRGFVGTGANILVPGFVIGGGGPLQLLIRAVGPGLAPFGVGGLLADPQIVITPLGGSVPVAGNDNWGGSPELAAAFAAAGAFALPPDSRDAAVLVRLPPGAYTVTVSGVANATGTALVEVYDVP